MRRIGFQLKLSIIFIIILVFSLVGSTYFIYRRAIIQQKEELRGKILSLAKLASMLIDGDKHTQIKPVRESQDSEIYKEIKAILQKIKDSDPVIDSVYTMVKTDKENLWMFVVDSGDRKREVMAYCGERYDVSPYPQMQRAFELPSVDKELTVDKWGVWLSGYAPIYNQQGQAVAIVGLDVSAKSIQQMQGLLAKRFLGVLVLVIVISLVMSWFIAESVSRPLRILTQGVREVSKGNFTQKVEVKSRDELQELAGAFNKMTDALLDMQTKLQRYYLNTVKALVRALEAKDHYTKGHSERVTHYAVNIAKRLGLSKEDIELLQEVCLLHDIGKIGIPERILVKSGPLSEEERLIVQQHPRIGEDILSYIEFLRPGLTIVRDHHERPDGKGYPNGLKSEEISILAAIVSVADAFDAMTSNRPYRQAFTKEEAITILKENQDKQFSAQVVDAFIDSLKKSS